jgi:hypothetical protein
MDPPRGFDEERQIKNGSTHRVQFGGQKPQDFRTGYRGPRERRLEVEELDLDLDLNPDLDV